MTLIRIAVHSWFRMVHDTWDTKTNWKENFDDRTFWAGVLNLVAKGLAILHCENGVAFIRATSIANKQDSLPLEEKILLDELVRGHARKEVAVNMLSPRTTLAIPRMADALHREPAGSRKIATSSLAACSYR